MIENHNHSNHEMPEIENSTNGNNRKVQEIEKYLLKDFSLDSDYVLKLRSFAMSEGGLVNDDIRKRVWPLLLELHHENMDSSALEEEYKSHVEFSQVVLDVNRSIKRFPPGIPYFQRVAIQDQLIRLILRVITKHPQLQYYQGYHDVAITFLLVVGENTAFYIMEKLSTHHLKHFMEATMEKTAELLDFIFPLINRLHPELCDYLEKAEVGSMFCLPWFLTWYSHTLNKYENVTRLYDYFLASEPLIPLYLIPVIVVYRQDDIFAAECEMSSLHQELSQLPDNLPFDQLLQEATKLYYQYPPEEISKEVTARRMRMLRSEEKIQQSSMKNRPKNKNKRRWRLHSFMPTWFLPYNRFRFIFISASIVIAVFVYYRYVSIYDIYNQRNVLAKS